MRVISVINHKGGVGKTTTVMNVAKAISMMAYRVAMIDLDPQAHLSASLVPDVRDARGVDVLIRGDEDVDAVRRSVDDKLSLVPAGGTLADLDKGQESRAERLSGLKNIVDTGFRQEDFVFIDCPPSSGLLAISALLASHEVIVPVVGDYLSLCGVSRIMKTIEALEKKTARNMPVWFAMTKFHPRGRLAREVQARLIERFPGRVLNTVIRESVSLAESPARMKTIFDYRPNSHGAKDYAALAENILTGEAA